MPVPIFTAGEILTAASMNQVGMYRIVPSAVSGTGVSITADGIAFTASTEIILDGIFSSNFRNYLFFWDGQSSAGGSTFNFQFRDATPATVATNYQYSNLTTNAGAVSSTTQGSQTSLRVGANDASGYNSMDMRIFAPNISLPTRLTSAFVRNSGTNSETLFGAHTASTVMTGLRMSVGSGNMTGFCYVYGLRE
jgi:hypothetical protein